MMNILLVWFYFHIVFTEYEAPFHILFFFYHYQYFSRCRACYLPLLYCFSAFENFTASQTIYILFNKVRLCTMSRFQVVYAVFLCDQTNQDEIGCFLFFQKAKIKPLAPQYYMSALVRCWVSRRAPCKSNWNRK